MNNIPFAIIKSLHPLLVDAARYADAIQHRIMSLEEKEGAVNIFAAALSDADLSIQTSVEIALISRFPQIPFFGEEWKSSANTKYLRATTFVDTSPYLVTLDPIDGTRPYLDKQRLYQIILTIVSREAMEAALVFFPGYKDYVFAVRGKGAFRGTLETPIEEATQWTIQSVPRRVFLDAGFADRCPRLKEEFEEVHCSANYSPNSSMLYLASMLRRELSGSVHSWTQVIDGLALGFVAQEMGGVVTLLDGSPLPRIDAHEDLILPGTIVASDPKTHSALLKAVNERSQL